MSNTALCLTALLLLIPIIISYKEGLSISRLDRLLCIMCLDFFSILSTAIP